ncbi:MAG: ATP-binding cassette domain-containing protein [Myxococcota bacterium]
MTPVDPVTGQPAAIEYRDVHLSFGDVHVLRGLDLLVPHGRITCLAGPSGGGKSLTFRLALGLVEPTRGQVFIDGEDLTTMKQRARTKVREAFGVVFQHAALFDSMNVFDNVAFPLREHTRMTSAEMADRVQDLLEQVGLSGSDEKMPSELSGGMRKRVGLARALAREPRFLFYDEPTSGLDPVLAAAMDQLILDTQVAHPHLTSFIISHDLPGALRLADKVVLLWEGRVRLDTDARSFASSSDPVVQRFLDPSRPQQESA